MHCYIKEYMRDDLFQTEEREQLGMIAWNVGCSPALSPRIAGPVFCYCASRSLRLIIPILPDRFGQTMIV